MLLDLLDTPWEELWAGAETAEALGAVYTRPEVVGLILDLAGYRHDAPRRLATLRVLEPGCGDGAFLHALVERLLQSERAHNRGSIPWDDAVLDDALRAVDVDRRALDAARARIVAQLEDAGCPADRARALGERWALRADFLLFDWTERFDLVCGNPPYLRIEDIPKAALARYRASFTTLTDRADLFIAFIERGLELLSPDGCLAFICANRFAKNQYGAALRRLIAGHYRVRFYLNLEHTQPFERDVSAYPAVLVIDRERGGATVAGTLTDVAVSTLDAVRGEAAGAESPRPILSTFETWYPTGAPWLSTCRDERGDFERRFAHLPTLEQSAPETRVGIGVATGADKVFVLKGDTHGVEPECLLPLAQAGDVSNAGITWSGSHLLNPFAAADDGSLVELERFPGFARYVAMHADRLKARHVAKKRVSGWYRTIDRVWPALRHRPKLLIPDIQAHATIGFDPGEFYPHHNLYWITSEGWELRALQALLRSGPVYRQVKAYSVQMRGGSLRWQAQTLRRVRLPHASSIPPALMAELAAASGGADQATLDRLAEQAFTL